MPGLDQNALLRARLTAGIIIPTNSMIARNSAIFQPHGTGTIAAIADPNAMMQTRTIASLPRLIRAFSSTQ
jgi:hypothetical protein